jgi:hypothetical protein
MIIDNRSRAIAKAAYFDKNVSPPSLIGTHQPSYIVTSAAMQQLRGIQGGSVIDEL